MKYVMALTQALNAAIRAVKPIKLLKNVVTYNAEEDKITMVEKVELAAKALSINVLAFGKASLTMTNAFLHELDRNYPYAEKAIGNCIVLAPVGMRQKLSTEQPSDLKFINAYEALRKLVVLEGATGNLPDQAAADNTKRALEFVQTLTPPSSDDATVLLVVLISGGGSALFCQPRSPITMPEKTQLVRDLGYAGASIHDMNCVRRAISSVKNGRFLQFVSPGVVTISLILSDVIGDDLSTIASGPTYRVPLSTKTKLSDDDPIIVLKNAGLWPSKVPDNIQQVLLKRQTLNDDVNDEIVNLPNCHNFIIGSNSTALAAAKDAVLTSSKVKGECSKPIILSSTLSGSVEHAAAFFVNAVRLFVVEEGCTNRTIWKSTMSESCPYADEWARLNSFHDDTKTLPVCIITGGETTVVVRQSGAGRGGRNQELVLRFAESLQTAEWFRSNSPQQFQIEFLSAGTDGQDGPTDAAGAVYEYPKYCMSQQELDLARICIEKNDSYTFWQSFRNGACHLKPGFTGTNVMDVQMLKISKLSD